MSLAREIQQRLARDLGERHRENATEEARLMQQINGAAQRLHALRSAPPADTDRLRWHAQVAGLVVEIDRLYERKRELIAARKVLFDDPRSERPHRRSHLAPVA